MGGMLTPVEQADAEVRQGMIEVRGGDFESALQSFRRAIQADATHPFAHNNLGSTLAAIGQHAEAAEAFRAAIALDANFTQAQVNLGDALRTLGDPHEAIARYLRALEIDPQYGPAYYSLGQAHQSAGRPNEALACYLRAMDITPEDGDVFTALGAVLMQLRLPDQAAQAFERALNIDETMGVARAHLIYYLARNCEWDRLAKMADWIARLGVEGDPVPPFNLLALEDNPERHRIRSERFADAVYSAAAALPIPARPKARPERLRIGYFSADFRDHATMFLAARMFELHDRSRFSIHAYSYGRDDGTPMRGRAIAAFDKFNDVSSLSDREIAQLARDERIDVAVDLKGYTDQQRLGIFAYRPAQVQITFLGYPGTLGTSFIDYLIADQTVVPEEQRHAYSENLIYLPNSYQVNDNGRQIADAGQTRKSNGLPETGFIFCCFNSTYKITSSEFDIWMDLLKQVDGSILWLLASSERAVANLRLAAEQRGVDSARLVFASKVAPALHLARQRLADLCLDTFNCNAHTTASDALWAGVPLVTKPGRHFAARVAASLLKAVGLEELVTRTERDYAELALSLAKDPAKLAAVRAKLQAGRMAAPLFDTGQFTRHLEAGFDLAHDRYVKQLPPADIRVKG